LRLLSLVASQGEVCSCDLQGPLGKSQPTVSHHTKALADAGLIVGDRRGKARGPRAVRAPADAAVGTDDLTIRAMERADWPAVRRIYAAGIATGNATFESDPPTWDRFAGARSVLRLVAVDGGGEVIGWAAAGRVSDRRVYAGVVEHSVYVDPTAHGRGRGRALLEALIARCEELGIWTIQSGIFPENLASLALHGRCGFRVVGTRERVGCHHGRWRDVVMVERRSRTVGA
jgi:phosphinothricin acetyltransferase